MGLPAVRASLAVSGRNAGGRGLGLWWRLRFRAVEGDGGPAAPGSACKSEPASLRVRYRGPVRAPIAEGQAIAKLEILVENRVIRTVPLVAAENVATGSVLARARDAALELSRQGALKGFRWLGEAIGFGTRVPEKTPTAQAG